LPPLSFLAPCIRVSREALAVWSPSAATSDLKRSFFPSRAIGSRLCLSRLGSPPPFPSPRHLWDGFFPTSCIPSWLSSRRSSSFVRVFFVSLADCVYLLILFYNLFVLFVPLKDPRRVLGFFPWRWSLSSPSGGFIYWYRPVASCGVSPVFHATFSGLPWPGPAIYQLFTARMPPYVFLSFPAVFYGCFASCSSNSSELPGTVQSSPSVLSPFFFRVKTR